MLISSSTMQEGSRAFVEGDKIIGRHVSNATEVLKANAEDRKDPNNGFSKERAFRHIARLDPLAYFSIAKKYPEIDLGDKQQKARAWRKVRQDPEFVGYFCVSGAI